MSHNLGQGETGTSIKMRGFFSSSHGADAAVYIDGAPQNLPSSIINHGMNDMSWLTPDMIERIEVIKGPFSALYGDQNRSGAINIITRSGAMSSIGGTLASHGTERGSAVFSTASGPLTSLLVGDLFHDDGYRANSNESRGTIFLKESLRHGATSWALRGMFHKSDWNAPGFLNFNGLVNGPVKPTDRDTTTPPLWGDAQRASLVFTGAPLSGNDGLRTTAYYEDYKRTRALGANLTDLNVQRDDRRVLGARVVESIRLGRVAALDIGADTRRDRGDAINRRWLSGVPGPNYSANQDLNLLTYGAFAQGQFKPIQQVKLVGGLRWDAFDYTITNRKLPAASVQYDKSIVTPRVGIVVTPLAALDLFANLGQGFRSPNQSEISPSGGVGPLGASGGTAYPGLAVPKATSRDIGFTAYPTARWQLSAAGYHTLNENEITQVSPGVFASVGNTTRDGWEVETAVTVSDATNLYASYGRIIRAQINNPLPGTADRLSVPAHTLKSGVGYAVPTGAGRILINVDGSYISGVPFFAGTPLQLQYTRQYTRFDVRTTYERQQLQVTAFATSQPVQFSSEVATSTATGVVLDPRPSTEAGVSFRYRFMER
jgi:outer membrane receptor protein involved in Fe transport